MSEVSLSTPRAHIVVMKFGGTSVEDATAIKRTAAIVAGRARRGLSPIVVVSAMSKVTDQLLACAAAAYAGRGDKDVALEISARLRNRHLETAAQLTSGDRLADVVGTLHQDFDALVIGDIVTGQHAVMTMARIGIERDIAEHAEIRKFLLDRAHRFADQVV